MKFTLTLLFFLFTQFTEASCYKQLTEDYSKDSAHFQIQSDEINSDLTNKTTAHRFINKLTLDLGCSELELEIDTSKENNNCIVTNSRMGLNICHIETNLGYFIVSNDMLGNINIIFNRWD